MEKKKISIIGAASISAAFIIKFIARHSGAEFAHVCSSSQAGKMVHEYHTFLKGIVDVEYEKYDFDTVINDSDIIFITAQHGVHLDETARIVKAAKEKGAKVIDLSADYRLKDASLYDKWYNVSHGHSDLLVDAVYGLTELNAHNIKDAQLLANPGCYPTCALLSLAPIVQEELTDGNIVINALSGVSGAGIRPSATNTAMKVCDNIFPYKVGGVHPHTAEIEQGINAYNPCSAEAPIGVTFVPHVAPFKYGIIETIYAHLAKDISESAIYDIYKKFYANSRFVNILEPGYLPEVKDVVGTNFVNIGFKIDPRTNTLIVIGCIDNVIKGAAGQAVQNMNIMCGFDEAEGLL